MALPSFKTRDDYLAIITIAANYIINTGHIINIDFVGGPRGPTGMRVVRAMESVAEIPWMMIWMLLGVMITTMMLHRLVNSTLGKGIPAVCQNEVLTEIMSVNTKRVKLAFMVSAGIAGGGCLYAHMFSSIYANSFGIMKSTEAMVMVYLGGMGSLSGSVLAAAVYPADRTFALCPSGNERRGTTCCPLCPTRSASVRMEVGYHSADSYSAHAI